LAQPEADVSLIFRARNTHKAGEKIKPNNLQYGQLYQELS